MTIGTIDAQIRLPSPYRPQAASSCLDRLESALDWPAAAGPWLEAVRR